MERFPDTELRDTRVEGIVNPQRASTVERWLRHLIGSVFVLGIRQRDAGAISNAIVSYGITLVPGLVEGFTDIELRPWQRLYINSAMTAHSIGMIGPYDHVSWWDKITHTQSASILAGIVFAHARCRGVDPRPRVLAVVVIGGIAWEVLEYSIHAGANRLGIDPPLVMYSRRDTAFDLVFNLVGALLVLAFGDRLLANVTPSPP